MLWNCFLLSFLLLSPAVTAQSLSVNGYVEDIETGERIPRVNLYLINEKIGTSTNEFGYFNLNVRRGVSKLSISHIVYQSQLVEWPVLSDTSLVVRLTPRIATLDSLTIISPIFGNNDRTLMSQHSLTAAQIETMPAILGEADVIKTLQLLPGAKPGREGFSGLHVRGGNDDQNLIQLDGLTLYNPNHIFGLFSVFNPVALKEIELIKGGFPARYGGRLSSVVRLTMKDGNLKRFGGEGKLGILTSRLMLEGPIVKDRASWIISVRRTFLDQITRWAQPREEQTNLNFFDLNLKSSLIATKRDRIYLSGYIGGDNYTLLLRPGGQNYSNRETTFRVDWRNQMVSLRWHRLVSDQMFMSLTAGIVGYDIQSRITSTEPTPSNSSETYRTEWNSSIRDYTARVDVEYKPAPRHYIRFGVEAISHLLIPSSSSSVMEGLEDTDTTAKPDKFVTSEYATYLEDKIQFNSQFHANLGLRYSGGQSEGYRASTLEPRASVHLILTDRLNVKASYALMQQYLHRLTGTGSSISRETWIPFMSGIPPQKSSQVAVGLSYLFPEQRLNLSLDGYYKHLGNQIEYSPNILPYQAALSGWPSAVENGYGTAYGVEVLLRRQHGRLNGWISYTWSQSNRSYSGLNNGLSFPDTYDRTHDISVLGQMHVTQHTLLTVSWIFISGSPIWLPSARYFDPINDIQWFEYTSINSSRVPPTHRLDLGAKFTKQIKWGMRTFSIGLLNLYNRRNPMYIYPQMNINGAIQWRRVTLLQLVPDISYGIRF